MNDLYRLTFYDVYEKNARTLGDNTALFWKDQDGNGQNESYADLFTHTQKLAAGLNGLGLTPGTRVAVLCKNHPVFFHLFGAAAALTLNLVLINRRLSDDEVRHIIEDTTPSVIICDGGMAEKARQLTTTCACLDHCFVVDGPDADVSTLYQDAPFPVNSATDAPFVIIHTAAVQGKPRGAVLSQDNIMLSNLQLIRYYGLDRTKCHIAMLPLFHIMGVNMAFATLQAGGKNVILEKFHPQTTIDLIQEQQVNLLGSFPPILSNLLDVIEAGDYDLSSLDLAAGLDTPETVKRWIDATGASFWTMYGQTETSGLITFSEYFKQPGSAGEISPLAHVKIADDLDTFLPAGQTGEIVVRGPLVFQGYWNAPELNEHTFREGWHHTGDLGMIDSEGFLFFKGRKAEKELIKPGGENVFPAEVEKAILQHGAVKEVCVFGVPDPKFGEGIKAVCALHPGKELAKEELIGFTGTLIAGYKKPRYVEFVQALPKADDGSIDRAGVKQAFS